MKAKQELADIIAKIASDKSPVGMDAVYVHALILDKLARLEERFDALEKVLVTQGQQKSGEG